jgi:hypothetical protein
VEFGWALPQDLKDLGAWGKDWTNEDVESGAYSWPERDEDGDVVGFGFRLRDGRKGSPSRDKTGLRRGLVLVAGVQAMPGRPAIVEGASDVAALLDLSVSAIGRPSNGAGADILARCRWLQSREPLVVGERDQKDDGRWPGRDGAVAVAASLANSWGRPVGWTLPPEGHKDARAWLTSAKKERSDLNEDDPTAKERARSELMEALVKGAQAILPQESEDPDPVFEPISAAELIRQYPQLRPKVIEGLLRQGEVMNLVAAPKVGKTWLGHALAIAVARGAPFLGLTTAKGNVLLIDGELHRETLASRLSAGGAGHLRDELTVWPVRGKRYTIDDLVRMLESVEPGQFALIVIDALYRFLPLDGEENSNETMTLVFNAVDALAARTGAAVVLVHHTTKGSQSGKAVTDVGSGGGAQSRAPDTHLVVRPHEQDGAVLVDAVVRSWKKFPAFVIRWINPGWERADDLDPTKLKKGNGRGKGGKSEDPAPPPREWTPQDFASEVVGPTPSIREDILDRAKAKGLSKSKAESLLKRAEEGGQVVRTKEGPCATHRFSEHLLPSTSKPAEPPGGGRRGVRHPQPPEPDAPGGCGGDAPPPSPPSDRGRKVQRKKTETASIFPSAGPSNRPASRP